MAVRHSVLTHLLFLLFMFKEIALIQAFELGPILPNGVDASVGAKLHIAHPLDRKTLISRCPQDGSDPNCQPEADGGSSQTDDGTTGSGNSESQPESNNTQPTSENDDGQSSSNTETTSNEEPSESSDSTPQPVTDGLAEGWTYRYCATDDQNMRALDIHAPNYWEPSREQWSVEDCVSYCADGEYEIAGLEWEGQCYCGNKINPESTQAPESDCSDPCFSNPQEACGNDNRLSLYARDGAPLPESSVGQPLYSTTTSAIDATTTSDYPTVTTTPPGEYDYETPVQDYTPSFEPPEDDSDYIEHDGEVMTNSREGIYQYQVLIDADTNGEDVPLTEEFQSMDTSSFLKCTDVCNMWNEENGGKVACEAVAYYGPGGCFLLTNLVQGEDGKYSYYAPGGILGLVLRNPSYPEPREGITVPPDEENYTTTTATTTPYSTIPSTLGTKSYEPWSVETIYPTAPGGKRTVNVYYSAC